MENLKENETVEFLWRRLTEDCPPWAIAVPVLFALFVVALIVLFRPQRKLFAAVVGGSVVVALSLIYLPLAFILRPFFSWMVILLPVMAVALFYVVLMYIRDARSVHPVWAFFLGFLRTCVYVTLAAVFLLPGCQHFEKQEYEAKVVFLFDVSSSMFTVDDVPREGEDPKKLPSRQDKILRWLTAQTTEEGRDKTAFVDQVLAKTPMTAYRFGAVLDETDILNMRTTKTIPGAEWRKWLVPNKEDVLKPNLDATKNDEDRKKATDLYERRLDLIDSLKEGTNIGGAALQLHKIESNSYLQAIVVISDGQSNLGSDDARTEFLARVNNPKRMVPVITVGVGQFRQPASILVDDLQAPEETRPDDKFPVRVPVIGRGLHDEEFTVKLEVTRVKDVTGKPVTDRTFVLPEKKGKFKGAGDNPQDIVEFDIDVQELKGIKALEDKNGDLEGEWHITASVPRNPKESFAEPMHVTNPPLKVQVQKRALRVLLFAGGATREYQFLRTILYREMTEKRMEMCIYLQSGRDDHIDQDVEPDRLLSDFPGTIGPDAPGQKYMSLSDYDLIIAFDPDWARLTTRQLNTLREWVGTHAGGVIFVAGPVFTYQVARAGGRDIDALKAIFPVVLKDNRLHGLGLGGELGHDATRPYALTFSPAAKQFDFLKLDETSDSPIAGWNGFFFNSDKIRTDAARDLKPRRGFFTYYPVEKLRPDSSVIATFAGPEKARINDGKDDPPFMVAMRYGAGKTLYIGSGELWRLRSYKDGFHERLWIKMARYVAAGAVQQKKYARFLLPRTVSVGVVNFEAQIKGRDLLPLSADLTPTVLVKRIDKNQDEKTALQKFDLRAKPGEGDWQGFFIGSIQMKEPGEYEFQLPIPNTSEIVRQSLIVRKPNPELDNVRTNFGYLYQLASEAGPLLARLPAEVRREVEPQLQVPQDSVGGSGEKISKRLFFPLSSADAVAKCLKVMEPKSDIVKGRFQDLWDYGVDTDREISAFRAALFAPLVVGVIGVLILLLMRQWVGALVFFGICAAMSILVLVTDSLFANLLSDTLDLNFSYLMMIVVSLLGIEWLARKLLRLA